MSEAKLAIKQSQEHATEIRISEGCSIGGNGVALIAGPCSVEDSAQMDRVAMLLGSEVHAIRGGLFKPRTSPYAFQGLGKNGLAIVERTRAISGLPFVSEVMSASQIEDVSSHVDILQVGSRNMQNFDLLKALGRTSKPVLLKRGLAATVEEFLMAAEYILSEGNHQVILCERGIRSFDNSTRNVLDLGAVVLLKQLTHLPVIVDPSHAAGKSELIAGLSKAAIACGADGLIIEAHPEPDKSVSDARQALSLEEMAALVHELRGIARSIGRSIQAPARDNRPVRISSMAVAS